MAKNRILMPKSHYLGLVHALTSAKGAPDWVGVRESRSLEAMLLSTADRLSGHQYLVDQLAPQGGWVRQVPPASQGAALCGGEWVGLREQAEGHGGSRPAPAASNSQAIPNDSLSATPASRIR